MITITRSGVIYEGKSIEWFRLRTLQAALELEIKGIRVRRNFSAYATLKRELGLTGSRKRVLEVVKALVGDKLKEQEVVDETAGASSTHPVVVPQPK